MRFFLSLAIVLGFLSSAQAQAGRIEKVDCNGVNGWTNLRIHSSDGVSFKIDVLNGFGYMISSQDATVSDLFIGQGHAVIELHPLDPDTTNLRLHIDKKFEAAYLLDSRNDSTVMNCSGVIDGL